MISKELLSKVLGLTVVKVPELDGTILWYKGIINIKGSPYTKELSINIYELAYKCKEWALSKNYILQSSIEIDCGYCEISYIILNQVEKVLITAESEPEAVFKACEWILDKDSK